MKRFPAVSRYVCAAFVVGLIACNGVSSALARPVGAKTDQQPASSSSENTRDAAIHDCSVAASKWGMSTWQTTQYAVYGECMTDHDQPQ